MEPRRMSAAAKRWRPSWGSVSRVIEHRPWSGRSDQSLERLTAALSGRAGGDRWSAQSYEVLREVSNTDFLQAVTLLATTDLRAKYLKANSDDERAPRVQCRRVDILNLNQPKPARCPSPSRSRRLRVRPAGRRGSHRGWPAQPSSNGRIAVRAVARVFLRLCLLY